MVNMSATCSLMLALFHLWISSIACAALLSSVLSMCLRLWNEDISAAESD